MNRKEAAHIFRNSQIFSRNFDAEGLTGAYVEALAALEIIDEVEADRDRLAKRCAALERALLEPKKAEDFGRGPKLNDACWSCVHVDDIVLCYEWCGYSLYKFDEARFSGEA